MSSNKTVIAVDAMGGDLGPSVVVPGAIEAARQTGAETGSHAAVERAGQQGGEHDHNIAGVEIAAGHGRDLDDERRHAAQRHEHGGVDEISEFLVHNYHLFMLLAQEYDIRHK